MEQMGREDCWQIQVKSPKPMAAGALSLLDYDHVAEVSKMGLVAVVV